MNEVMFVSKDFEKDIRNILKKEMHDVTEKDLEKIERIHWNGLNIDGSPKDYQINELTKLKNLKIASFSRFLFTQEDFEALYSLSHLQFVSFDFCEFYVKEICFASHVEEICFNVCHSFVPSMLKETKIKKLQMVGSMVTKNEIDVSNFEQLENMTEVALNRFYIKNINALPHIAPKLKILNVDGSELEEEWNVEQNLYTQVSHQENFHRANA